jgi:hypothetical protein
MSKYPQWIGRRKLREDGHKHALAVNLGKAAKLIEDAEPGIEAQVTVLDDNTIQIKIIDESDTESE